MTRDEKRKMLLENIKQPKVNFTHREKKFIKSQGVDMNQKIVAFCIENEEERELARSIDAKLKNKMIVNLIDGTQFNDKTGQFFT